MGLEIPFEKAQVLKGHDSEVNSLPSYLNLLFPDSFFLFIHVSTILFFQLNC